MDQKINPLLGDMDYNKYKVGENTQKSKTSGFLQPYDIHQAVTKIGHDRAL